MRIEVLMELKDKGVPSRHTEGSNCRCSSPKEHIKLLARIDASFQQDYDMHSERRQSAPTSETMRARALSVKNGHGGK